MNADIRTATADAERALEAGDLDAARRAYVDAGDYAVGYQLWRSALRSYRSALELDLVDRAVVAKIVSVGGRLRSLPDWLAYGTALDVHAGWLHFGCRHAQVQIDDRGAYVDCAPVGRVIQLAMPAVDRIETIVDPRFAGMPLAMGLTILRRAMWPNAREQAITPMRLQVVFGHQLVWLDELGEWEST